MPEDVLSGFRNYIGSVAANRDAGTIAVTSPQGNSYAVIEAASGKVVVRRAADRSLRRRARPFGLHGDDGHGHDRRAGRQVVGRQGLRLGQPRAQDLSVSDSCEIQTVPEISANAIALRMIGDQLVAGDLLRSALLSSGMDCPVVSQDIVRARRARISPRDSRPRPASRAARFPDRR